MNKKEIQMILDAFQNLVSLWPHYASKIHMELVDIEAIKDAKKAIRALRQALAQEPDDERIAALRTLDYCHGLKAGWNFCATDDEEGFERAMASTSEAARILKKQPAPAQPWVGLTDDDKREFAAAQYGWEDLLAAADAKLKEKNT